jgi:hypothetical protein
MSQPTAGTVLAVRDCGALVMLFMVTDQGQVVPIHLERCSLGWMLEGEGCGPGELVGRRVGYDGQRILFLDGESST